MAMKEDKRVIKFRACPVLGDRYKVGDDGSIWGIKGKPIKQYKDDDGYPHVYLVCGTQRHYQTVHKLILTAFVDKPVPSHEVNHINGIRDDNRLENLEWVTHQYNVLHSWRINGRKASQKSIQNRIKQYTGINNPKAKLNEIIVLDIRKLRTEGVLGRDIAKKYGISTAQVYSIANLKSWKYA